jgi:hypothetical protein
MQKEPKMHDSSRLPREHLMASITFKIALLGHGITQDVFEYRKYYKTTNYS